LEFLDLNTSVALRGNGILADQFRDIWGAAAGSPEAAHSKLGLREPGGMTGPNWMNMAAV
jgi:hypothetical protein